MKIKISENDNLPAGEYELTDRNKLENAKGNIGFGRSDRLVLLEYDRIAGRVSKNGVVLPPQSLWNIEQQHMNKPIEQFSDEELLTVIRRAENTNVPGSLYQRANSEWQIRHQQKLVEATRNGRGGISFEVGGNMINDGVIHADPDARINIAVAGDYKSTKGKILQQENFSQAKLKKNWFSMDNPIVYIPAALFVAIFMLIVNYFFTIKSENHVAQIVLGDAVVNKYTTEQHSEAKFTITKELGQVKDGKQSLTIKAIADKDSNLPNLLCLSLKTDVQSWPASKRAIINDGPIGTSQISSGSNYACINNPSISVSAYFLVDSNYSFLDVYSTTTKANLK